MSINFRLFRAVFVLSLLVSSAALAQKGGKVLRTTHSSDEDAEAYEARMKWFNDRWHAGPRQDVGQARLDALSELRSMNNSAAFKSSSTGAWEELGGSQDGNVSGRPTGIAFHPTDPNTFYLATAEGGVWKTTDKGNTWVGLSDSWATLCCGGVAVDWSRPNIIYAGTGDQVSPDVQGTSDLGIGVYRSTDGGANWTLVADKSKVETRTFQMIVDPVNPDIVYHVGSNSVKRSTDMGMTWASMNIATNNLVIDPSNTQNMYAGGSGVKRSTDGGKTWVSANTGLTSGNFYSVAICKNEPNVLYVSIGRGGQDGTVGLGKSTDNGKTWTMANKSTKFVGSQAFYANAIAVNPANADEVIAGGLDIYRSMNGGSSMSQISFWTNASGTPKFTHADIHILTYNPYDNNALFALTDGGVFISTSSRRGDTWQQSMNKGLHTLQFVGADANRDFTFAIGGTQDNGMNRLDDLSHDHFTMTGGGDGGFTSVSQTDGGQTVYSTFYGAQMRKSADGGKTWITGSGPNGNYIAAGSGLLDEDAPFFMHIAMCESDPSLIALCGNSNVYLSTSGGEDGFMHSITTDENGQKLPGAPSGVHSAHISAADPQIIFLGGPNFVSVSSDQGSTWKKSKTNLGGTIAWITADPKDPGKVYAVRLGYGGGGASQFWMSTDTGMTWTNPAKSGFPDVSCNCITIGPKGELFIAHDLGVLYSLDNGTTWAPLMNGFPLCQAITLTVRGTEHPYLLAATYGRGLLRYDLNELPPMSTSVVRPATASAGPQATIQSVYPNPVMSNAHEISVKYSIAKEDHARLALYDELGREVHVLMTEYAVPGDYSKQFDLSGLTAGKYFIGLTSAGKMSSSSLIIN